MANTVQLTKNGQPVYPITDVSLIIGLEDAIKLPPVKVTTLPTASAETAGKMYYVGPTNGEYERYITSAVNGSYEWIDLGDTSIPLPSIADNLTTDDSNMALSAKQGVVLDGKVSQLGQEINGLPDNIVNQIAGINTNNPSIAIFQNIEPTSTRLGTSIEADTESPFRDLIGKKIVYFRAQNAIRDNRFITDGLFSGATTNKVVFSYWVKKADVLADAANCVVLFTLWQTSSWNDQPGFTIGLKGLINGGVGTTNTYTKDTGEKLKSVRTVKFAYELDGWCQIVQTHELTWYDTSLTLGVGVKYETAYPSRIAIVNPQIIINADAPIGKYVIKDVADSIDEYPQSVVFLFPRVESLEEKVEMLTPEKKNILHISFTPGELSYILSPFNENFYGKLTFYAKRELTLGQNRCFNFQRFVLVNKATLAETVVDSCLDDIAPINYNFSYFGANHANSAARKLTIPGHGLGYANIGEVWNYGEAGEATILAIFDANNIIAIGKQTDTYPKFKFDSIPADAVLSKGGANLTVTASESYQWHCATDAPDLDVFVDGELIAADGDYPCNEIKLCESYNIFNTQSVLELLRQGVGTYTNNPNPASFTDADKCTRLTLAYIFPSAAQWFIASTFTALQDIGIGRFGFTQQGGLDSSYLYIPKALPVAFDDTTIDFRTAPAYTSHGNIIYITSQEAENPNLPPDRWLAFNNAIALHSGYLFDYGIGGAQRKDIVNNYFYLPGTLKIYPNGVDSKITVNAGDSFSAIVWRTFIDRAKVLTGGVISVNLFAYDGKLYIYADFNQPGIYEIEIPEQYVGKAVTVFEKRDNVTLLNPISGRKILVKVDTASPMYGYIVAQINP